MEKKEFELGSITLDHAGQLMFPDELARARAQHDERLINSCQLREVEDQAIRDVVERQRKAGITRITDGLLRRKSWDLDLLTGFGGVEKMVVTTGHIWQDVEIGSIVPDITGEITYNPEHPMLRDFEYLVGLLNPGEIARINLPSPAHLLLWLVTHNATGKSTDQLLNELTEAYRDTLLQFYAIGCRSVVLRDTSWQDFCDPDQLKRMIQGGFDPITLIPKLREANEKALAGLPADIEKIIFVKAHGTDTSDASRALYAQIVSEILAHKNVDAFMGDYITVTTIFENATEAFPADKGLILGITDIKQPQVESPEELREKITTTLSHISPAWMRISPADGFKLSNEMFNTSAFTETDQWHKLDSLREFTASL